ncbi:MAG: dockerin type I repeat-containing protein [Acidobacteria bacterium]|nr:dockerin type I repeat-containing protein [Acidobacteriota bacterium]
MIHSMWSLPGALVSLFFCLFPAVALADSGTVYDIHFLELYGNEAGHAYQINNLGQIVGMVSVDGVSHYVFWDLNDVIGDGETHSITESFHGDPYPYPSSAWDINDEGYVVGQFHHNSTTSSRPYRYDGVGRTWGDLGDAQGGAAFGINSQNHVVGVTYDEGIYITLWTGGTSGTRIGEVNHHGEFYFINDLDQICGTIDYCRPVKGSAGGLEILPVPPGYRDRGKALAINNDGTVVGWTEFSAAPVIWHATLWEAGYPPLVLETPLETMNSIAYDINSRGDVVGTLDNRAVLWTGFDRKLIDLSIVSRPFGWRIARANGINDHGWICGWAGYGKEANYRPCVLIPRVDEAPPEAELVEDQPAFGTESFQLQIRYTDEGILNESTLDGADIHVTGPNDYSEGAEFVHVEAVAFLAPNHWFWDVIYEIPAPDGVWDENDIGDYNVSLNGDQVCDMAAHCAEEGILGTFSFSGTSLGFTIMKGLICHPGGSADTWRFSMTVDAKFLVDNGITVGMAHVQVPGGNWYDLSIGPPGIWSYTHDSPLAGDLDIYGDGVYLLEMDLEGFLAQTEFLFGIPGTAAPLPQPSQVPAFIHPINSQTDVQTDVTFQWSPVTDGSVNAQQLLIMDETMGRVSDDILLENASVSTWGFSPLIHSHEYEATLYYHHGYFKQVHDYWSYSQAKYTAVSICFTTEDPNTATYIPGDLSGSGQLSAADAVILHHYLAGNIIHGAEPFTESLMAADVNADGVVTALDLVLMSNVLSENILQ